MITPTAVDFHFDPMCPFAHQAARWIRAVREQAPITVSWRFFSLEEVNRAEGEKHPWQRDWSYGWSLMRIGALLRRRDMALLDAWYDAIGRALHERGEKPHEQATARRLLGELGLDAEILDRALADPSTHEDVYADHEHVVASGGFGVPTLFFADGQCLFGPVLVDPPTGPAALRLWDIVTGALEFPHLYELQRPKSGRDHRAIAQALEPYLRGRDWVSVDRGRVIPMPGPHQDGDHR
ncbi:DsbA family protein [Amycolatopsis cihanbeyliensis]|uniref:Putative DsbA family dithiol-disulfide isomerase n=1 Tax=Amycolatopsis cihanbeyliensis TaxID=1128664 RepID=A0A542DFW8_AMYCI|nr:DsbA family protein [Amycolatopsis cihanbeyliensis]TQJ01952.1 putative DsbA family dithiol-disulfide isomerase [Amycolatopsis cihanbeyliensis]